MNAFVGTPLTEHIGYTPEKYLVCRSVAIARVGWQEYRGAELSSELEPARIFKVWRDPEQVFSPVSMASAEGKAVTRQHPPDMLTVDSTSSFQRGHCQNVRRDGDLLVADLIITCPLLSEEILSGRLRECSCGYQCIYTPLGDDTFAQENIAINHIAICEDARAGSRVSIRDAASKAKTSEELVALIHAIGRSVQLPGETELIMREADDVKRLASSGMGPGGVAEALRKSSLAYAGFESERERGQSFADEMKAAGQRMQQQLRPKACRDSAAPVREHEDPAEDFREKAMRIGRRMRGEVC